MINIRIAAIAVLISFFFSCQNDDWKKEINKLREELNVQRQLIEALQNEISINDIVYDGNSYTIRLANDIYLVFDNTLTPIITIDRDNYYLLNGSETGVKADGIFSYPVLTTESNGNWFINGIDTDISTSENKAHIINVFIEQSNMVFAFNDGTQILLPIDSFSDKTENDICLPRYLYMLSDTQNNLFIEPFIKRWRPETNYVRFIGSTTVYSKKTNRGVSIDNPKAWATVGIALYDSDFKIIKSHTSIIRLGEKGVGSKKVYVQIMGDSFVQGAFFKDALLTQNYVPNIQMVGLRKVAGETDQYDEGRGGDMLHDYFSIHTGETKAYQGYMHPDNHTYYGATGFWKNCHKVADGIAPELSYSCGRFDYCLDRFDSENGYLITPNANDVMFDNNQNTFIKYTGTEWIHVKKEDFVWNFNYKKYLEAWELPAPQFFGEMLGLNDFRNDISADFSLWNERIAIMKDSYLEAVPDGKFMILIPSSTCGSMNNTNGDFTLYQNASMWRLRKNIIDNFDNRESEGYYLVDIGISIDNEDGYNKNEDGIQIGNPHPYPNYPVMGIPLASFIQFHREK
jgi:hypothetical protein